MPAPVPVPEAARARRPYLILAAVHVLFYVLYFTPRLREDAPYYYEPLRSAFFDGDVNYYDERPFTRHIGADAKKRKFVKGPNERQRPLLGGPNNTFDIGTTVLAVPPFLAGHAVARALQAAGAPVAAHGYSPPYVLAMALGFLLAGLAGSFALYATATRLAEPGTALLATVLGTWGSFMPAYFYEDTLLSHLPSYVACSALLWLLSQAREDLPPGLAFAAGAAFSWLVMARRQNGLLVVLLLLAVPGLLTRYRRGVSAALASAAAMAAGATLFVAPQLLLWRIQYGSFLANPGMVPLRSRPVLGLALFSDHGGLFSHSPVLLPAVLGLAVLVPKDRLLGLVLAAGAASQVLINTLRVEWWPGIGFGNRRSDSMVPILVLGLAALLQALPRGPRRVAATLGFLLLLWNMAAIPQFYAGDGINEKGSHYAAWGGQRAPGKARFVWPFPAATDLPAIVREDAAIVARQSFTLSGRRGSLLALLLVASSSLLLALGPALSIPPRVARAAAVALALLLSLPPLLVLSLLPLRQRSVLAIYYDPPEPIEPLTVGPGPFRGGVAPVVLDPGQQRTFALPAFEASALELVAGQGQACFDTGAWRGTAAASEGEAVGFPSLGRHQRLAMPAPAVLTQLHVASCGTEPLSLYGLAAVPPGPRGHNPAP